ncbi:MBL fold metallo-hydrolase [Thermomicrobium sp. 4228-Ro]|uniref:MBL fold metallo-hydrolase n=1 Tax=Thermomicrobium sp. 4228-Ro TaxID=2993937 RepID=UPI0022491B27|nr:MBL fold metallo-hydrolase [Thermomicrobium sp. 4228-Ro]MCX2726300.1 MBL fold metallo-hydrolase [Thermomicrobium sp. 4228-Ro]
MVQVHEVEPGWYAIDLAFQHVPHVIASYVFVGREGATVVDTGPQTTLPTLLAALSELGIGEAEVRNLVLTHIHLDHAGAAGHVLERCSNARVFVHPVGAPHLVDPSRLWASAARIYGDRMEQLWGEVRPCPSDRVVIVEDNETIELGGGRCLRALATPGHASHHHAYLDTASGSLFAGDVAGIRIGGQRFVFPPTPPPDIDLGQWRRSIERLRQLRPTRLYLGHFGAVDDPEWHFDDLLARLFLWGGWISAQLELGQEPEAIAERLRELTEAELGQLAGGAASLPAYQWASGSYRMTVDGYARYFRSHRPFASGI